MVKQTEPEEKLQTGKPLVNTYAGMSYPSLRFIMTFTHSMAFDVNSTEEPYAGKPHVRFRERRKFFSHILVYEVIICLLDIKLTGLK